MGIIRNSANRKIKGRVGDMTYYVSKGLQIARQALNNSNYGESARRSEAQQVRRVKWSNLVNFYKVSKAWMPKAFESKKAGQTDYNKFMSVNIGSSVVALTHDQALQGACVAEPFIVTQGSLPSISHTKEGDVWLTNLRLGNIVIDANTTAAEFSQALLLNNAVVQNGMQLSFVSYQQASNNGGVPYLVCTLYEITLDTEDTNLLRSYLPDFCTQVKQGYLSTNNRISVGAFTYILSDSRGGNILVSTQELVNNNSEMISIFSSANQVRDAINSYGVDTEVVLSPISRVAQGAVDQPLAFTSFYSEATDRAYVAGDYVGTASNVLVDGYITLQLAGLIGKQISSVKAVATSSSTPFAADMSKVTVSGNTITVQADAFNMGSSYMAVLTALIVVMADGKQLQLTFAEEETHE